MHTIGAVRAVCVCRTQKVFSNWLLIVIIIARDAQQQLHLYAE